MKWEQAFPLFSDFSCGLMSLLASRSFEWSKWEFDENIDGKIWGPNFDQREEHGHCTFRLWDKEQNYFEKKFQLNQSPFEAYHQTKSHLAIQPHLSWRNIDEDPLIVALSKLQPNQIIQYTVQRRKNSLGNLFLDYKKIKTP